MDFCHRMVCHEAQCTWPNANVVLFLAAHSFELFLKGAVLAKKPNTNFGNGHNLHELQKQYDETFGETELSLEPFFLTEAPGRSDAELAGILRSEISRSIRYRYPVDRESKDWPGIHGFSPKDMFGALEELGEDYSRIRSLLPDAEGDVLS